MAQRKALGSRRKVSDGCFGKVCGQGRVNGLWRKRVAAGQEAGSAVERALAGGWEREAAVLLVLHPCSAPESTMRNEIDLLAAVTVLGVLEQGKCPLDRFGISWLC